MYIHFYFKVIRGFQVRLNLGSFAFWVRRAGMRLLRAWQPCLFPQLYAMRRRATDSNLRRRWRRRRRKEMGFGDGNTPQKSHSIDGSEVPYSFHAEHSYNLKVDKSRLCSVATRGTTTTRCIP